MESPWLDLLNSDFHDYLGRGQDEDRLENREWLQGFLARWDLASADKTSLGTRRALGDLRGLLQRMVSSLTAGKRPQAKDMTALNAYLAAGPVVRQLERQADDYRLSLVPVESAIGAVLCEIATSFAEVLVEGDPDRIKICENSDCCWVYYDRSRNRTRRWCEGPKACGNLMKVRRFRQRQKKAAADRSTRSTRRLGRKGAE